jgi:hypothetical protein
LSFAIAEKSLVKDEVLSCGTEEPEPEPPPELLPPLLPHAETARAMPAAAAVRTIFLLRGSNETTLVRERACKNRNGQSGLHGELPGAVPVRGEHYAGID